MILTVVVLSMWGGGTGGRETGRKGGGRCTGGGRRGGGKRDSQGGGKRKKKGKLCNIAQCFAIEKMQRAGAKKYRAGTGIKDYGKREVQTPPVPPLQLMLCVEIYLDNLVCVFGLKVVMILACLGVDFTLCTACENHIKHFDLIQYDSF